VFDGWSIKRFGESVTLASNAWAGEGTFKWAVPLVDSPVVDTSFAGCGEPTETFSSFTVTPLVRLWENINVHKNKYEDNDANKLHYLKTKFFSFIKLKGPTSKMLAFSLSY